MRKFRNVRFVGDLILSSSVSFIMMTSLWRHLYTLDKTALLLKASRKEQCYVNRFWLAKQLSANVIQSEMRLVYGDCDKCFMQPAIHV